MLQQRRAANRVQQMQEHSRQVFEAYQGRPPSPLGPTPFEQALQSPGLYARPTGPASPQPHSGDSTPLDRRSEKPPSLFSRLETEQWLLLGLALLLFRCGCRTELLLALVYLAL